MQTRSLSDVLVVGGGIIGVSIAEALASEGLGVRLIESESTGSGASGAAAGMLAPMSEAQGEGPLLDLGLEGLRLLRPLCDRLRQDTGIDPEFEASGLVQIALDTEAEGELRRRHLWLAESPTLDSARLISGLPRGFAHSPFEWVESTELQKEEPAFSSAVEGGLRSLLECHLRPPLLLRALERSARAKGVTIESGVRALALIREGDRVIGVDTGAGGLTAGAVVVAAGPWTPGLLASSGIACADWGATAIEPVRGQILSLEGPLPETREIVWGGGVYFVPKRDGRWIVGATEERVGFDRRVTASGIADLLARACSVFPVLGQASFVEAWSGLRPVSRDGLPSIGGVEDCEGLYVAAGHGRNGVLQSAATAERIRDELLGKRSFAGQNPFRPDRVVASGSGPLRTEAGASPWMKARV